MVMEEVATLAKVTTRAKAIATSVSGDLIIMVVSPFSDVCFAWRSSSVSASSWLLFSFVFSLQATFSSLTDN